MIKFIFFIILARLNWYVSVLQNNLNTVFHVAGLISIGLCPVSAATSATVSPTLTLLALSAPHLISQINIMKITNVIIHHGK